MNINGEAGDEGEDTRASDGPCEGPSAAVKFDACSKGNVEGADEGGKSKDSRDELADGIKGADVEAAGEVRKNA